MNETSVKVQEHRMVKVNAFMLKFIDSSKTATLLTIRRDHHAEQILRGLVHSGFEVTIKEIQIEVAAEDYEKSDHALNGCNTVACEPTPYRERD